MYSIYINNFLIEENEVFNGFVLKVLNIAENYLKFLISKNKIYLPEYLDPKDTAVDLLAEIFERENNVLIKFRDFFKNNFNSGQICNESDFENYLRGFIYSIVQNNLQNVYRDNDSFTYNIYRNIKNAVKSLNYFTSIHFSDKYIHSRKEINFDSEIADKEDLLSIIYSNKLADNIFNIKKFIESLFKCLESSPDFCAAVRLSDLAATIKTIFASEYLSRNGAATETEHFTDKINVKFLLDDARFAFNEKLDKYLAKNNLPKNFSGCMYNLLDEVISDMNAGNNRQSVMELMKTYFKTDDKYLFYKVQYCIELFEAETAKFIEKEKVLIG